MLEIIDEEDEEELIKRPEFISIGQLLDYFINEVSCRNDFEFMQAVVRLFLKVTEIFISHRTNETVSFTNYRRHLSASTFFGLRILRLKQISVSPMTDPW